VVVNEREIEKKRKRKKRRERENSPCEALDFRVACRCIPSKDVFVNFLCLDTLALDLLDNIAVSFFESSPITDALGISIDPLEKDTLEFFEFLLLNLDMANS
jgi:hypothetical protein